MFSMLGKTWWPVEKSNLFVADVLILVILQLSFDFGHLLPHRPIADNALAGVEAFAGALSLARTH